MKRKLQAFLAAVLTGALLCQPAVGLTGSAAAGPEAGAIYLSDLSWQSVSVGWGNPSKDQGLSGGTIAIRGADDSKQVYRKGLVLHAPSSVTYDLTGSEATAFRAVIGIDDNGAIDDKSSSSSVFIVQVDGVEKYKSPSIVKIDNGNIPVEADIPAGAKTLTLITTDGGNGNNGDHCVWADARLLVDESKLGSLQSVSISAAERLLAVGDSTALTAEGALLGGGTAQFPEGGLTFSSSDESVASVTADGKVTAKAPGAAAVTVTGRLDGVERSAKMDLIVEGENSEKNVWSLTSPEGKVSASLALSEDGRLLYALRRAGETLLQTAPLGLTTSLADFSEGLEAAGAPAADEIDETYSVISSRKDAYTNHAMERSFTFKKDGQTLVVQARAYDDGFAFRYSVPGRRNQEMRVSDEASGFRLPAASAVWAMPYSGGAYNYEGMFTESTAETLAGGQSMPLLYKTPSGTFVLLSEANLDGGYIGSQLFQQGGGLLKTAFVPQQSGDVTTTLSFNSPWRTVLAGELSDIVEGSMAENVAYEPERADYDWVEAGGAAWSWIAEGAGGYDAQKAAQRDPAIIKKYIDLAAEMGWKYFIMDEGWQPDGTGGDRYAGYYDWFDEIAAYAESKQIGLIAWVLADDLRTEEQRVARLDDWAAHGIKGIKVDFFDRESQDRTALFGEIYTHCAELHMVVNAHGSNKPTGEVRTYPNVLTREAIRGREYGGLSVEQYTILPFTRTAIGPADVTETVYPAGGETAGFMNALSVLVQSGIHCYASGPEDYLDSPVYTLYKDMPSVWDDTRFVDGYPGDFAALMRRSGEDWYGAAVSVEARTVAFPMDVLGDGTYYALIYKEGSGRKDIALEVQKVTKESVIQVPVMENGGCAVKVVKKAPSGPESIALDSEKLTVEIGEQRVLRASITPADPVIKQVSFTSSDESVAAVTADGKITGVGRGTAVITASSPLDSDIKAVCTVKVAGPRYELETNRWEMLRKDEAALRFPSADAVQITAGQGDVGETDRNPLRNVFYMTPGSDDFTISVKVSGGLGVSFQTAALTAFTDDTHMVAAMRRYHGHFGGNCFEHMTYLNGYDEVTKPDTDRDAPAWLRLEKKGGTFLSSYSMNGVDWITIAEKAGGAVGSASREKLKIGIFATVGSGENAEIPITFSDFTYTGSDGKEVKVPFGRIDPAGVLDNAKWDAEAVLKELPVGNALTADEVLAAVREAVDNPDIDTAWSSPFRLAAATGQAEGRVSGTLTLAYGGETAEVVLDLIIPKLSAVKGDLTGDGKVNISDVMAACKVLARKSAGQAPTPEEVERGDVTGEGEITITDVMAICKIIAQKA